MIKDVLIQDEAGRARHLTATQLQALVLDARQARARYAYSLIGHSLHPVQAWLTRLKASLHGVVGSPVRRRKIFKGH